MSDDERHVLSLVPNAHALARTALVRRGVDLADALAATAAKHEYEVLGESIAEGTTVVLTLPELSPVTLPTLLDENVTVVNVLNVVLLPGAPLESTSPVLEIETDRGTYIELFASWCVGWPARDESVAGRVKEVKVKAGDTVKVGQPILTVEVTRNDTAVRVIRAAVHAELVEAVRAVRRFLDEQARATKAHHKED